MTSDQGADGRTVQIVGGIALVVFIVIVARVNQTPDPVPPREPVETTAEVTGVSGPDGGLGEWRIGDASRGNASSVDRSKMQLASLTATDGDLVVGVWCTDDIVDQVVIGFANEAPSIWVHGGLYLSVDGGEVHSNWSQKRTGDLIEPWRGFSEELDFLDGPRFLERLARSTQLVILAWRVQGAPILSVTFDGSGLEATLAQMGCRLP